MLRERLNKKVEKIELEDFDKRKLITRLILFIFFFVGGITLIIVSITRLFTKQVGWQTIEAVYTSENTLVNDVQFQVYLNDSRKENQNLYKKIRTSYSTTCEAEFKIFDTESTYEDMVNICYINEHPNEEIEVDPFLYKALQKSVENKFIFMGPLAEFYDGMYTSFNDSTAHEYDPYYNNEVKTLFADITNYVNNGHISISFLENNVIKLNVSSEYLNYLKTNELSNPIDFGFTKYAFFVDSIYDLMVANNVRTFIITSVYGFTRVSNRLGTDIKFTLLDLNEDAVNLVGDIDIGDIQTFVNYRTYPLDTNEAEYYIYQNAEIVHHFIDSADGKYKSFDDTLYLTSEHKSCVDILNLTYNLFVNSATTHSDFDIEGINYIGFLNYQVKTNLDTEISFFQTEEYQYTK